MDEKIINSIGFLISILTLLTGFILYCIEKIKSYNRQLKLLKKEIESNLKSIKFSRYEETTPLELNNEAYKKLVENLKNEISGSCFYNGFTFFLSKRSLIDSKDKNKNRIKDNTRKSLRRVYEKINELKLLSSDYQINGLKANPKRRLNFIKMNLEIVDKNISWKPFLFK